jgi:hypothetical protein
LIVTAALPAAFASTVTLKFTALPATLESSTYGSAGATYNGEVPTIIAGISNIDVVCDSFASTTYVPSGLMDFTVETMSSFSGERFTAGFAKITESGIQYTLTAVQAYDTAAVLMSSLAALPINSGHANAITDYQYAIWDLMEPGATDPGTSLKDDTDTTTSSLQQIAFAAVLAGNAATLLEERNLVIYTPTAPYSSNQEFLGQSTPTANPEPATWLLMVALGSLLCVPQVRSRVRSVTLARG